MPQPAGEGAADAEHHHDWHDLGPRVEADLVRACGGRLRSIGWFRSDWQIGGAATAYAVYECEGGPRDVVVKLPIGPREQAVLTTLGAIAAPTPRIVTQGERIEAHATPWVVMERLPGNPLAAHRHRDVFPHLVEAAAGFYEACRGRITLDPPRAQDWPRLLERARASLHDNPSVPHHADWTAAVKRANKALPRLLEIWDARTTHDCCHGDLHPGNCMERPAGSPWGEAGHILFDFADAHRGHWVEDAVYMERLYWARPDALDGMKPVSMIAKARRARGLPTTDDYPVLADVRRALMAATTPAFLEQEGHPAYLNAALHALERALTQLHL